MSQRAVWRGKRLAGGHGASRVTAWGQLMEKLRAQKSSQVCCCWYPWGKRGVCKLSWKQCGVVLLWLPKTPRRPSILCSWDGGADHLASLPFSFVLYLDHLSSWPAYSLSCLPPHVRARGLDYYRPELVTNSCTLLPGPRTPFPGVQEYHVDRT